jgi:hypothetical protein
LLWKVRQNLPVRISLDFLHGNINPAKLAYRDVFFDGTIPLPKRYEDMAELAAAEMFMDTLDPGWNDDKKRPGVLFPRHHMTVVFSGKESGPTASEQPDKNREE